MGPRVWGPTPALGLRFGGVFGRKLSRVSTQSLTRIEATCAVISVDVIPGALEGHTRAGRTAVGIGREFLAAAARVRPQLCDLLVPV